MKYVLLYDSAPGSGENARLHFPAHRARWAEFRDRGDLLLIGPFPEAGGAMAVFRSREAAEAFAGGDPFVLHGVVGRWEVRAWNEALQPDQ